MSEIEREQEDADDTDSSGTQRKRMSSMEAMSLL